MTCKTCNGRGEIRVTSHAYASPGEGYAPCPDCREIPPAHPERCAVCGGPNPGDVSHTRCAS